MIICEHDMPKENYFAVRLDGEDAREVQELKRASGFSQNQVLKEAVSIGLPEYRKRLNKFMPGVVPARKGAK